MKLKQTITLLILSIAFCGCTSMRSGNALMQIKKGMNSAEVIRILGEPKFRSFVDEHEDWMYEKLNPLTAETKIIVISFANDEVFQMDSFSGDTYPIPPLPQINNAPVYVDLNRPQYPNDRIVAMKSEAFESLYNGMNRKPFKDDKFELLEIGIANNYLTCNQCVRLMSMFSFDDDKLNVLKIVSSRIIDNENFMKIIDSLTFKSNQDEAKKMMAHSNRRPTVISNERFESLYNQIKKKSFKDEKLEVLRIGVGNSYFTCKQCARLMSLYSFDDEKLSVLRIIAPNIIDRVNSETIIDSLSFISSRDEAKKILRSR